MIKIKKRKFLLLPGDGIGPEVVAEVKKIIVWFNKMCWNLSKFFFSRKKKQNIIYTFWIIAYSFDLVKSHFFPKIFIFWVNFVEICKLQVRVGCLAEWLRSGYGVVTEWSGLHFARGWLPEISRYGVCTLWWAGGVLSECSRSGKFEMELFCWDDWKITQLN